MHKALRCGRLLAVAFATYFATGCGSGVYDAEPPQSTTGAAVEAPSQTRLAEVQLKVGQAALAQGNLQTAFDMFEKAHKTAPQDARPLAGQGDVLFAQRKFGDAATAYRAALSRDSGLFEAHEGLGKALVSEQNYVEGLHEFEAALAIRSSAPLLNKIGVTHEMLGHGETAQKYYRKALALQPDNMTARNNLALSLGVSGSYDEALTEMRKVVASPGAGERHRANLAFIYGLSGRSMKSMPPRVSEAAASKGWDDGFFTRTRKIARSGNRTAVLDLLNNRRTGAAPVAMPSAAALPEMPDSEPEPADKPDDAPAMANLPTDGAPPAGSAAAAGSTAGSEKPTVLIPPPPPPAPAAEPVSEQPTEQAAEQAAEPTAEQPAESPAGSPVQEQASEQASAHASEQPGAPAAALSATAPADTDHKDRPDAGGPAEAPAVLAMRTPPETAQEAPSAAPAAAAMVSTPAGPYRVQLGAFRTTRWLRATLAKLGATAADKLPGGSLYVTPRNDLFLVRSYGLPDRDAAKRLCEDLRARGFACFVTRTDDPAAGHFLSLADARDPEALRRFVAGLPKVQVASADAAVSVPAPVTPAVVPPPPPAPAAAAGSVPAPVTPAIVPPPPPAPEKSVAMVGPAGSAAVSSPDMPSASTATGKSPETGAYRVQLAAYRLARHLKRGIAVLSKEAGDLLPPLEGLARAPDVSKTAIPFRLRSAPLESRAAAQDLCRKLSEKGIECLVIRHGARYWQPLS